MQDTIINFYSTSDDYGDFSNFAAWPIKVDGKTWPTSEHYFQAQKFLDEKYREEIRRVSSPMVAARMGRDLLIAYRLTVKRRCLLLNAHFRKV